MQNADDIIIVVWRSCVAQAVDKKRKPPKRKGRSENNEIFLDVRLYAKHLTFAELYDTMKADFLFTKVKGEHTK